MGWLRKKGRQLRRGVKKVFKKIGQAFGKLGVLGQIGMMFLMPYAAGALGSFFGTAGTLSKWSSALISKSGIGAKALGHGLNMINKAGTFAGKVYTTVSEGISNGLNRVTNFAKGKGFTLSEGKTSVFGTRTPESLTQVMEAGQPLDITKATPEEFTQKLMKQEGTVSAASQPAINWDAVAKDVEIQTGAKDIVSKALGTEKLVEPKSLLDFDVTGTVVQETTKPTLMDTFKSVPSKIKEGIQDFDVSKAVTTGLTEATEGAIKLTGTQKLAGAMGYETPEGPKMYNFNLGDILEAGYTNPQAYRAYDYSLQSQGNNWLLPNIQNSNYLNNLINENDSAYQAYMANFAASQYTPMQRDLGMGV